MTVRGVSLCIGLLLGIALPCSATTISFGDLDPGTRVSSQYANLGVVFNMSYGVAEARDFSSLLGPPFTDNQVAVTTSAGFPYGFLTISFSAAMGTVAASTLSFDVADMGASPLVVVQSYAQDATLLEELIIMSEWQHVEFNLGTPAFIVVMDAMADGFVLDNLSYTLTPVPEPASLAVTGAALVTLILVRRRFVRTKSSSPE